MSCAMASRLAPLRRGPMATRPAGLTSSFVSTAPSGSMFRGCSGIQIVAPRQVTVVKPLTIVAGGRNLGCTKQGSNRHSKKVSGFRARMQTPTGRAVLKARRKKGRKLIAPASVRRNGKTRL